MTNKDIIEYLNVAVKALTNSASDPAQRLATAAYIVGELKGRLIQESERFPPPEEVRPPEGLPEGSDEYKPSG